MRFHDTQKCVFDDYHGFVLYMTTIDVFFAQTGNGVREHHNHGRTHAHTRTQIAAQKDTKHTPDHVAA